MADLFGCAVERARCLHSEEIAFFGGFLTDLTVRNARYCVEFYFNFGCIHVIEADLNG